MFACLPDCTLIQGTSGTRRHTSVIDCVTTCRIRSGAVPSSINRMDDVLEYYVSYGFGTSEHDSAVLSRYVRVFLYLFSLKGTYPGSCRLGKDPARETTPGDDSARFGRYQ